MGNATKTLDTSTLTANLSPIPGIPAAELEKSNGSTTLEERFYELSYRYGNVPHLTKVFKIRGTLRDAIERARIHCTKMKYTFIWCRPFLVDLDDQERLKREDPNFQEIVVR